MKEEGDKKMSTYCESIGLKVGDEIIYMPKEHELSHEEVSPGDVLTLVYDDDTFCPKFSCKRDIVYFCLKTRGWAFVDAKPKVVKKTCWQYGDRTFVTHDELLNYLTSVLTAKELLAYINESCTVAVKDAQS